MDKGASLHRGDREVRRVFSRLSKHTSKNQKKRQQKLVASGSKKDKLKKSRSVVTTGGEDQQPECMGSVGSDAEDEVRPPSTIPSQTNKKSKLPKKFLEDCGTVDHVPIPRKLRSAIKKRSCNAISLPLPDSKKMNHSVNGFETSKQDGPKRNGASNLASGHAASVPFTKDEEEVAETLFALAGLIPDDELPGKNKSDGGPPFGETLDKSQMLTDAIPASEAAQDVPEVASTSVSGEVTRENVNLERPDDPELSERKFNLNVDTSVSPATSQATYSMLQNKSLDREPFQSTVCYGIAAHQYFDRLNQSTEKEAGILHEKSETASLAATQVNGLPVNHERKENGITLQSAFPSRDANDAGPSGLPFMTSAANFPPWLKAASTSSKARSNQRGMSNGVLGIANTKGKSWKRCAAHVYISRLVQVLKISEGKDVQTLESREMNSSEELKQGFHPESKHVNGVRHGFDGVSNGHMFICPANKNLNDAANGGAQILNGLHQSLQQVSASSEAVPSNKQQFDFLSLSTSTGQSGAKSHHRMENNLDQLAHLRVPHLRSLQQQTTVLPFSLPQFHQPSNLYRDQLSDAAAAAPPPPPQVHLQRPAYYGNSSAPAQVASASSRMPSSQQQQQMWAAHLAAQWRPGALPASSAPNWQNRMHEIPSSTQYMQTLIPTSQSSLEALRARYAQAVPPQQQQLMSLLHTRAKVQHSQLAQIPSNCEQNGRQFRHDGVSPLQLLCKERQ